MTEKFPIKQIKEALEKRQDTYKELGGALDQEATLARAKSHSARRILEGEIAGFVARQLPTLNAPLLGKFDLLAVEHNHPQRPMSVRNALIEQTQAAAVQQVRLEAEYGTTEALAVTQTELQQSIAATSGTRRGFSQMIKGFDTTLAPLDRLNKGLDDNNHKVVTPETLADYDRPKGLMARMWRYATDKAYREARPVLDAYQKQGTDLPKLMTERATCTGLHETTTTELQSLQAEAVRVQQRQDKLAEVKAAQKSDREILNEVRIATASMILSDPAIFWAADKAFPGELDAGTKAMHTRMQLFGQLATNISQQKTEMEDVAHNLDKPVKDLAKAIRNGIGSKKVEFDLHGKTAKLDKHQLIMTQRVGAAKDIRKTSHSYAATSGNNHSSNDSTNWLLWYLILSDNSHAHTAPSNAFNSGMGGDFGGGGASGDWDKSDNSFFKAELLGVTPDNAASFGIDAKNLSIPADVSRNLASLSGDTSTTAGDFNSLGGDDGRGAGLAGAALGGAAFSEFNDISKGMDLGSISRDIGSLSSELAATSSSDWGSSGSSYNSSSYSAGSYDSGSSYSSGDSGGGGSCSCD